MKKYLLFILIIFFHLSCYGAEFKKDIVITDGVWSDSRAYSTFASALTSTLVGENLMVNKAESVAASVTTSAGITIGQYGSINVATGQTLTFASTNINARPASLIGNGSYVFAPGTVLKSSWFASNYAAIAKTAASEVVLIIDTPGTITSTVSVGNNVILEWEGSGDALTCGTGISLQNIGTVIAGKYTIFKGAGDFDFATGVDLKSYWFDNLYIASGYIADNTVNLECDKTETLDHAVTIPSTVRTSVKDGTVITTASNALTINGEFYHNTTQCFSGSGVVFGALVRTVYPIWWGTSGIAIQYSITSLPNGGEVVVTTANYSVTSSITITSNITLRGINKTLNSITLGTAGLDLITGTSVTGVNIKDITLKGSNTGTSTERLVLFDQATNCHIDNCDIKNSVIGVQFHDTCTNSSVKNSYFDHMVRLADYSLGYGILADTNNTWIDIVNNNFNDIERHCVYLSSGTSHSKIIGNYCSNIGGIAITLASNASQNRQKDIIISDNIIETGEHTSAGSDDFYGICLSGNIEGSIVEGNTIRDLVDGGGILVQNGYAVANGISDIGVEANIMTSLGLPGITCYNANNVVIKDNILNTVGNYSTGYTAIYVNGTGSGTGTGSSNITIRDNQAHHVGRGFLNASGSAGALVTNLVLGHNIYSDLSNIVTSYPYIFGSYTTYNLDMPSKNLEFYQENILTAMTTVAVSTGPQPAFYTNSVHVPFTGYVTKIWAMVNGAIYSGNVSVNIMKNSTPHTASSSPTLTLDSSNQHTLRQMDLGYFLVEKDDVIGFCYSTSSGLSPSGSLDLLCGMEITEDSNYVAP